MVETEMLLLWKIIWCLIDISIVPQVIFDGVVGANYTSDIAIDDILIQPHACADPINCDFENGLCSFQNRKDDDYDWIINSPQSHRYRGSAPAVDHTTSAVTGK